MRIFFKHTAKNQETKMSETDIIEDINCMSLVPDEIVVKIFSYVPIQDLGCVTQVSRRFHQLSQNESLWVKFNASEKTLPVQFLGYILHRGTKFLSLFQTNLDGDDPHIFPKQNKLKYLNLFNCSAKTEKHLIQLIFSCQSLEKLSIGGKQISKFIRPLLQQNSKTLKVLDISAAKFVTQNVVEQLVRSCLKLQEINISGTRLPRETINFLCKNLPESLLKISLGYLKVTDENLQDLVNRCAKMVEIDLHGTEVTDKGVLSMINSDWCQSMVKLGLPTHDIAFGTVLKLESMKKLQYLWWYGKHRFTFEGSLVQI